MQYPNRKQQQPTTTLGRDRSPRNARSRGYNQQSASHVSAHSENLWKLLEEEYDPFPAEYGQLLAYQDTHISAFKTKIERQKIKANNQMDAFKKEVVHHIEDLKLSIQGELDNVYKLFIQKFAEFKGELMDIKRLKDEIQIDLVRRSQSTPRQIDRLSQITKSNIPFLKFMKDGSQDLKKYHVVNYIAELQKEKVLPLNELAKYIVVLTQYQNHFLQSKNLSALLTTLKENFRSQLRSFYSRKYQFIRDPQTLVQKDKQPILSEIYQNPPVKEKPVQQSPPQPHLLSGHQERRDTGSTHQVCGTEWVQQVKVVSQGSLKLQDTKEMLICAIEPKKNFLAIGSKSGAIFVYNLQTNRRVQTLRGHKASICTLAMVSLRDRLYLASGGDHGCNSIAMWDINTWELVRRLEGHKAAVTAICDLKDNLSVATGSYDKRINIFNLSTGKIAFNLPANQSLVTAIVLNQLGDKMVSCDFDKCLTVWQVNRQNFLKQGEVKTMFSEKSIRNKTKICSLVASIYNPYVVYVGTNDGMIKMVNIERGEAYGKLQCCNQPILEMLIVERQSKPEFPFAIGWPAQQECLKIVNTEDGKVISQPARGNISFSCGIGPMAFFLHGSRSFAVVSQSQICKEVNFFRLDCFQ